MAITKRLETYLIQLRLHTPLFRDLSVEDLTERLAISDSAGAEDLRGRTLTVLWLNLISGRLNRATAIAAQEAADPDTVATLIDELHGAESGSPRLHDLLALAHEVSLGQRIRVHVCGRLVYRTGTVVRESIWSSEGYSHRDRDLAGIPKGITTFSPDGSGVVIECPCIDSAGGPLYLGDWQTETLQNLKGHLGLPDYTGVSSLEVRAWHYDNRHLLLVNEADEVIVWLDRETGEFTPLALGVDTSRMGPPREFTLSPDGSALSFITVSFETDSTDLHRYDFQSNTSTVVTSLPVAGGSVTEFAFSPDSRQAAYLVRRGTPSEGCTLELHLIDLDDLGTRVLLSGDLSSGAPVWSPDGQYIAFTRQPIGDSAPSGPQAVYGLGDIWLLSIVTGETTQLTSNGSVAQPPVWSPDGQHLAFATSDGQIAMVSVALPGQSGLLETDLDQPQLTTITWVP